MTMLPPAGHDSHHAPPAQRGTWQAIRSIYRHLGRRRHRELGITLGLMVLGAFAELVTVGAVLPFLATVAGGDTHYPRAIAFAREAGMATGLGTLGCAALLLSSVAVLSTILRLLLLRVGQDAAFDIAHDLATDIYDRTLQQPYGFHVAHNSSRTLAGVEKVQHLLGNVMLPAMQGLTAAIVSTSIFIALLLVDWATSIIAGLCFALLYVLVSLATRRRLYRNADLIARTMGERVQTLQEGLGGIRDVLLDRSQAVFLAKFSRLDARYRHAQASNQFIGMAPRYIVEAGGVVLIAVLTVWVARRPGGVMAALPMLGALALGAQRLLPLIQQVYFSSAQIHGNRGAIEDVAALLDMPLPPSGAGEPVPRFSSALELDEVGYTYPGASVPALKDLSLTIRRGERIGIVGRSGSGKTTLADVIMGLLDPSQGEMRVDGRRLTQISKQGWQAQIAHVPQALFLADCSIANNIAFGRQEVEIDMERVQQAAREAHLHDFICRLPHGYGTLVGERGIRLSGGQRQRIGIARALYKRAGILVLDEATSALDGETEAQVMGAVAGLSRDLTVLVIAHRVSTLSMCDRIIHLDGACIRSIGRYEEMAATRLSL